MRGGHLQSSRVRMPRVRALHFGGVVAGPRVLVSEVNKLAQPLCDVSAGTVVTPVGAALCTRPEIADPVHAPKRAYWAPPKLARISNHVKSQLGNGHVKSQFGKDCYYTI